MLTRALAAALVLPALVIPSAARANCAEPVKYELTSGPSGQVVVQPFLYEQRGCGGGEAMLRQDVTTGETVRLAEHCGTAPAGMLTAPYIDECVPAGSYRYGFATPYACQPMSCGTFRWEEITVGEPPAGCSLTDGNPGPTAVTPVGWTARDRQICGYQYAGDGLFGCASTGRASAGILLVDAAAFALGWTLLRRRRERRT